MTIFNKQTISLFRDRPIATFLENPILPFSGSTILNAGWTFEDTDVISGSIAVGSGSFFNGDRQTPVTPAAVSTNWSLVLQLNSGSFRSINIYDSGSADTSGDVTSYGGWFISGSNSTITPYFSNGVHGGPWTRWQAVVEPNRSRFSGSIFKTTIHFNDSIIGSWIKLHASQGPLKGPIGDVLRITEVEMFDETKLTTISGSAFNQYSVELSDISLLNVSQTGGNAPESPAAGLPGAQA